MRSILRMNLFQMSFQILLRLKSLRAESTNWFLGRHALAVDLVLNQSVHPHKPLATFQTDVARRGRFRLDLLSFPMTSQVSIQMNLPLIPLSTNWTVQIFAIILSNRFRRLLQTFQIRVLLLLHFFNSTLGSKVLHQKFLSALALLPEGIYCGQSVPATGADIRGKAIVWNDLQEEKLY